MTTILIAVLADRYISKLERCLDSVDNQEYKSGKVLIINSLDQNFIDQAIGLAESRDWEYQVTISNGTSSKGKNSVLDYFASTDYEYLCLVDADDYLLPDASSILYKAIEKHEFDVLGLLNGLAFTEKQAISTKYFLSDEWNQQTRIRLQSPKDVRKLIVWYEKSKRILDWNRFMLVNKKVLSFFRFSENIRISDLQLCLKLKHYVNQNQCKYLILESTNVYMYDIEDIGDFGKFLHDDPSSSITTFWRELEGLDLSGTIPVIQEGDL